MAGYRDTQPYAADMISTAWDNIGSIGFRTLSEPHRKRAKHSDESTIDSSGLPTPADSSTRKSTCSEDLDESCSEEAEECHDHDSMVWPSSFPITDLQNSTVSTECETITTRNPTQALEETTPQPSLSSRNGATAVNCLNIYHREVDRSVTDRFDDVSKQLEPALVHYLHKKRVAFRPLAIQLLVLGATEQTAKPWIVVLCPTAAKKKVKTFFSKDFAVRICQGPPNCRIRFDAHVVGRPLKTLGRETPDEVFMEQVLNTWTPQIRVMYGGETHDATMGGFICVTGPNGEKAFYGLTVGHILPLNQEFERDVLEDLEQTSGMDVSDMESDSDSDSELCSDTEEDCSDSADIRVVEDGHQSVYLSVDTGPTYVKAGAQGNWASLGMMSPASYSVRARDRDWALPHITAVQSGRIGVSGRPFKLLPKPVHPRGNRDAMIDNKITIPCGISALPARVLLPSGQNFVDVKVLRMQDIEKPGSGASGSWIVSYDLQMRVLVFGMLIATDPFGSFWMMPMADILEDICQEMGATDVHLANHSEIPIDREVDRSGPEDPSSSQEGTKEAMRAASYFSAATPPIPKWGSQSGPPEKILDPKMWYTEQLSKRPLPE